MLIFILVFILVFIIFSLAVYWGTKRKYRVRFLFLFVSLLFWTIGLVSLYVLIHDMHNWAVIPFLKLLLGIGGAGILGWITGSFAFVRTQTGSLDEVQSLYERAMSTQDGNLMQRLIEQWTNEQSLQLLKNKPKEGALLLYALTQYITWLERAGRNCLELHYWLGRMYENGVDGRPNPQEACKCYENTLAIFEREYEADTVYRRTPDKEEFQRHQKIKNEVQNRLQRLL